MKLVYKIGNERYVLSYTQYTDIELIKKQFRDNNIEIEDQFMKHIAIISSDIGDFTSWLNERKIEQKPDSKMQVVINDTTYHCVYKPTHTISMVFDSVVETKNARKNDAYSSTLNSTQNCLKTQRNWK